MRIGFLADIYTPHVSGVTRYIQSTKLTLEKMGHEPYVFTFGPPVESPDETNVMRTPGIPVGSTGFFLNPAFSQESILQLKTMDILHLQHPFMSAINARRYAQTLGIPTVFTSHTRYDIYFKSYVPWFPERIGMLLLRAYLASFTSKIDLVISPSTGMAEVLHKLGVQVPIQVLPNGIDLTLFQSPFERVQRESIGLMPQDIVLVFFGRLAPEKNLDQLLVSFAELAKIHNRLHLIFIGNGPSEKWLTGLCQKLGITERVKFLGLIQYERLSSYLALCDAFVTTSISEVHPLTVIEAMAVGLPVLGISSPGVGDIVVNGVTGLLTNHNMADFTRCMHDLVSNPELRSKMGSNARIMASQYDLQITTRKLVEIYYHLIKRKVSQTSLS